MNRKQIILNIIANALSFIVSTVINFFLTPYITRTVGVEAYGFVPLASNFVSYITILTSAFNSMSGRFITVGIHSGNEEEAKKYFSTTFFINTGLAIFAACIFTLVVAFLERLINIPTDLILDTKILFGCIFASTVIGLLEAVFTVPAFCQNRLDIKSGISIVTTIVRAIILFCTFIFFRPHVFYIGAAALGAIIVESCLNIYTSKRLLSDLRIEKKYFEKRYIGILFTSGVWNSFSQLSSILMTGLDLLVANMFLGAGESGVLGLAKVFPGLIYTVVSLMIGAFTPQFVQDYAHNDFNGIIKTMDFSAKLIGFISVIPLAGFIVFGVDFYKLWVPEQNAGLLMELSFLIIFEELIGYPIKAFDGVFTAVNKLKWPALASFICGLVNVITMIPLLKYTRLGLYAVAGTSTIILLFKDIFFKIPYVSKCVNIKPIHFWKIILRYLASFAIICFVGYAVKVFNPALTWMMLIFDAIIVGIIGICINYLVFLNTSDRRLLKGILRNKINRAFL